MPQTVATSQPRVIALMNQKGGVGKTTTTANLAAGLALSGKRVLLIDLDPQAHLTLHLGVDPDTLDRSVYDLLTDPDTSAASILHQVSDNLFLLPAEVNLAGVESELAQLVQEGSAQQVLRNKVAQLLSMTGDLDDSSLAPSPQPLAPLAFDFILLDCPPSLGLLTINGLALATEVFVPMQAHFLALQGLSKLLETVSLVKTSVNPGLLVTGVVLCMHEGNTILANEVVADLRSFLEAARAMDVPWSRAVVLDPPVRRSIKLAECPSFGKTIFDYAPGTHGCDDYKRLAQCVAAMKADLEPQVRG